MVRKFDLYRKAEAVIPEKQCLWPLYSAGLENMGLGEQPIDVPVPQFGPDELLVRHDACGLCFSDIKVIRLGEDHPRIYRDMKKNPVVLGHEVSMTVVGVGENLKDQYKPGDRFIIQADIFVDGVGYAYGYEIQGGLSQYNVIDQRVLNGDDGNYLIPIRPDTGYAESALVEPWACVIAAYLLQYRTHLKPGGTAWIIGPDDGPFSLSGGMEKDLHPAKIKLTNMNGSFGQWLRQRAKDLDIPVIEVDSIEAVENEADRTEQVDDIILLSPTIALVERVSPYLTYQGTLAFSTQTPFERKADLDIGRVHYNRWLFLGGDDHDIAAMRMHVQRALETPDHPSLIVCSDASDVRLKDLDDTFAQEAEEKGIEWMCVNPMHKEAYQKAMYRFKDSGFDDIIMLVPIPPVIADAAQWLAQDGVMNVFAGVARGTTVQIDLNDLAFRDVRIIGHSASHIDDMLTMLQKVEYGELSTNRSVAAIGSLSAAKEGMQALIDAKYPGKVVIYPNINELPLTAVSDLGKVLPKVAAKLKNMQTWTKEAEKALLEEMLEG